MDPAEDFTIPLIAISVVDFPAPFAPRMATLSPSWTARSIPWRTSTFPYLTRRSRTASSMGSVLRPEVGFYDLRVALDGFRRAFGDLGAELQNDDLLAGLHDKRHVVLDEKGRDPPLLDPAKRADERRRLLLVHSACRFVEDDEPRLRRQCPGDLEEPLTSVGEI